ncbi:uncharacterized protein LOC130807464 [Amaranthus tricolor]|uniref:uncharacterized protein LOC130807464 n=1 Tax=Amaranthus tricolor TaxID=29722 RepID=UPI0025854401|nr:uncharacterized protein LOC130807464 [Amaranthus tricolor]
MASDFQDSPRKHHRSPSDDDSPEHTKRHKHRHHRHHRRHRHYHRHSNSKHDDVKKDEIDAKNREEVVENTTKRPLVDYDMEEGEIVEDEVADEIAEKKIGSDVESGEFKASDLRSDVDDSNMSVDADLENSRSNNISLQTDNSGNPIPHFKSSGSDQSDETKEHGRRSRHVELIVLETVSNGDLARRSREGESMSHTRNIYFSKDFIKEKNGYRSGSKEPVLDLMDMDEDVHGGRENLYSHKAREVHQEAIHHSPSDAHGRYHLKTTSNKSRAGSLDKTKERERSHRHERGESQCDNSKVGYEVDEKRDDIGGRDRADGGDKPKYKGREKGMEERIYREKKRGDRDLSKERSLRGHDRDWEKERDRIHDRDHEREKNSARDRDRHRETKSHIDRDRDRGESRDRDFERERERERERRRERSRGRSKEKDLEREMRRDDSMLVVRDKEREWDKVRDRSRKVEMDRGRDRYGDRDRHRDTVRDVERDRNKRYHKYNDRDDEDSNRDRHRGNEEVEYYRDREMKHDPEKDKAYKVDSQNEHEDGANGDFDDQNDNQESVELKRPGQEEDDIDRIKEESRRRREAILQKYKAQQCQQQQAARQVFRVSEELTEQPSQKLASVNAVLEEVKDVKGKGNDQDASVVEISSDIGKSLLENGATVVDRSTIELGDGSPKSERSNDMFTDDIFGDSPAGGHKMVKGDGMPVERSGLHDNWDDPEGYYSFRFGEILDGRYEITAAHGKGVFSTVVRAKDLKAGSGDPEEVAIKIIRNNETMLKAGTEELVILKKLVGADPDDRRHCVRYLSHFKYRNHLCIVFESLHMNLREVLKKFGRNIGLKLTAVRTYAKQLFVALKHLRNCGVLHCDIKPDNMLVNDSKNVLKLCDFGNAMFSGKNEITPYLVSRFYRAPEIILGLPYDHPMDIWSVGCCLYELYTGKVLFPGPSNNDMLRLHMELKGSFPKKMLRKGAFIERHFDQDLNFLATEEDPVTKKTLRRLLVNIKPKDIGNIIKGSAGEDPKMLANFKDLLEKVFVLDPDKRLTVSQALNHPFITGK